jgi:uncharacterized coiled-coil protein SlyX
MLADREEYIQELEGDHARQAEKIEKLTAAIAEKFRASGAGQQQ